MGLGNKGTVIKVEKNCDFGYLLIRRLYQNSLWIPSVLNQTSIFTRTACA